MVREVVLVDLVFGVGWVGCCGAEIDATVGLISLCRRTEKESVSTYHSGHVPETFRSQGSMHSGWNLWLHGSTLTSWPFVKSSVQTEHARPLSALASVEVSPSGRLPVAAAFSVVTFSEPSFPLVDSERGSCSVDGLCTCTAGGRFVGPSSTSPPATCCSGLFSSLSPNLTIGMVSSIALAIPLALLCLGLPSMFLGPYRSGCRCARTAPTTMIIRNSAVIMPVIL